MPHKTADDGGGLIKVHRAKIRLDELVPHERTIKGKKQPLRNMEEKGVLKRPIIVHQIDRHHYFIVDGHHRVEALEQLGCRYVIANVIYYLSPDFVAKSWRRKKEWDKEKLIAKALRGMLRKPKSTKHVVMVNGQEKPLHKNDSLEPVINHPLSDLK